MDYSLFIERLQELMIEHDLNAPSLAKELGCTRTTIHRYLKGATIPSLDISIKMANYFGCTIENLLGIDLENHINEFLPCPPFKGRIDFLCKHFGISRYELCKRLDISESVAYYWSKGKTKPSLENIIAIAKCFDCSIDFVIGRTKI